MTDAYTKWNHNLAAYFFNENMAGKGVLLYANFDLIDQVGASLGGREGFINAIRIGPGWVKDSDICVKAYKLFQTWQYDRSGDFPPYIAYLISFVLANYIEGDFDANAYYPRLKTLLRLEHETNARQYFDRMYELWDDLEKWSKEDREEELGSFTARVRGGKWHIGLPLSQTILSKEERDSLSSIFSEAYFEPGSNQPAATMMEALKKFGHRHFSKKTMRLLNSDQDKELTMALIEFAKEELISWSGFSAASLENETIAPGETTGFTRSIIKICLKIEPFSKKVSALLRVKANSDFPVDGLNFFYSGNGQQSGSFECKRTSKFWSTPLKSSSQQPYNPFELDWTQQLFFEDKERGWAALTKPANIKWFIRGRDENLPDEWVEASQIPDRNSEFALACQPGSLETVRGWMETQCEMLKPEIKLPNDWTFFQIKNARAPFPGIETPAGEQPVLRFRDGIRLGNRNAFISYCPPKVLIENVPEKIDVVVTGNGISSAVKLNKEGTNKWSFPNGMPSGQSLKIQGFIGGEEIKLNGNRMITFEEGNLLSSKIASVTSNVARQRNGDLVNTPEAGNPLVNGTKVNNYKPSDNLEVPLSPLFASGTKVILLGRSAGEVAELDAGSEVDFTPIWALVKCDRKRWLVQFCASSLDNTAPLRPPSGTPSKKVKEWRIFIWNNRKVNDSSQLGFASIKRLWEAYKNAAARL